MRRARPLLTAGALAGAAVLATASLAWACLPGPIPPSFITVSPNSVPAGTSQVLVSGYDWNLFQRVTLHWNSASGTLIGAAAPDQVGSFSTSATLPGAPAGDYVIVAVQGFTVAAHPFRITAALPPVNPGPATKEACKKGGWKGFSRGFDNQGDCVSYYNVPGHHSGN